MAAEMAAALRGALSACLLLCGESGGLRLSRGVDGAAVSDGDLGSSPPRTFNGGGSRKAPPGIRGWERRREARALRPARPRVAGLFGGFVCFHTVCRVRGCSCVL